ncbi:tudor domain-containing protein 6 [Tachyglossus aculeatus]|uniref:tudor domain-containing protein 6 n=1 Tax=Tachyglossus aculeatus TaxID=9261 RepID=UPI0018F4B666|nr:tudor domain-containing protein 6 [Tachyglossus aculeatus]
MCSSAGLPLAGSTLTLRVSSVEVHPEVVPVLLWGLVGERREDYMVLGQAGQGPAVGSWAPKLAGCAPGQPGSMCLVRFSGRWHRGRVVGRQALQCRVFLLDEGRTITADLACLAPALLQAEVLGCVLAGLVPATTAGGGEPDHWSRNATSFLARLQGKEVEGRVLDVLLPQRLVLLDVPALARQMHNLGLVRPVSDQVFRALLKRYLMNWPQGPLALGPSEPLGPSGPPDPLATIEFLHPGLRAGLMERMVVTQVSHPHHVYCQLHSFTGEVARLADSMAVAYGGPAQVARAEPPAKPGSPCATCGPDGRWHRAVLLDASSPQRPAQVLHVDSGRKELVSSGSLRALLPEYFRLPVVTYPCALYGLWDQGQGWDRSQVSRLRTLLLGQTVSVKVEFYSTLEHVYYITLYRDEGINFNRVFGVQACCLVDRMPLGLGAENKARGGEEEEGEEEEEEEEEEDPELQRTPLASSSYDELPRLSLKVIQLKAKAFYDARVEFVKDPSEFWVRLKRHNEPFGQLARNMCSFYSSVGKMDGVLARPQPDRVCCVKWKDGNYFRAVISRPAADKSVEVHLVDRGDMGVVGSDDVKELLPQFWQLPIMALKCSLAGACPLGGKWSPEAVSYFQKIVLHKEVVIHVLGKEGGQYAIEIFDTARIGEENVGRRLAQAGYARSQELEEVEVATPSVHSARQAGSQQGAGAWWGGAEPKPEEGDRRQLPVEPPSERGSTTNPVSVPTTRGKAKCPPTASTARQDYWGTDSCYPILGQLEVGSTVEVKVTFVENPGKFWCQLTRNIQELAGLMSKIQDYCKTSAIPHQGTGPACLARRAENGKWCRALIFGEALHPEQVEIMFIDYGNREVVSVKNLYAIREDFLKLKAQAFRCSLYNLIQPTGLDPLVWDETATVAFRDFVGSAWERSLELKCTVFAVASLNRKELFNIVDLVTPFQSICHFLTEKGHTQPVQSQNSLAPGVWLESYYYSTHDIKIGGEEAVCVTHIDNPSAFYCQLARSATVLERLSRRINQVAQVWQNLRTTMLSPGTLCLAKYNDQNWYRAIVTEKEMSKEVFFVDFGNTYEVTHDDLLPLPGDAYDLLLLPMQAIKCCLSDAYDHIPKEVALWFEKAILDQPLKAMVVAKDPEGRLVIELYNESVQINAKLNEKLSLLGYKSSPKLVESDVLLSTVAAREEKSENRKSPVGLLSKSVESTGGPSEILKESSRPKISLAFQEVKQPQSSTKATLSTKGPDYIDDQGFEAAIFDNKVQGSPIQSPIKPIPKIGASIPEDHDDNEESPLKLCDLPQKNIVSGLKTNIYVSHVNNLSDFYVQLTEDELELGVVSDKLNGPATRPDSIIRPPYQEGDLICAVFSEDDLWYRAVITEKPSGDLIPIQFIDYGNTSVVKASNISSLVGPVAAVPKMSIHCSLGRIPLSEMTNCPESVAYFSQRTNEAQVKCEFVKQVEGTWEVILHDEQGVIAEELMVRFKLHEGPTVKETPAPALSDDDGLQSSLLSWCRPDIKTLRAYATVIDGPEYFWCQFAETPNLKRLEREVQKAGARAVEGADRMVVIQQGDACIVKCREDGKFYRALVARVRRDLVTVRLVDNGNVENFGREVIWHIPDELLSIPMQAFPCCLAGLSTLEGVCSTEAKNYFFEIVTRDVLDVTVVEFKSDACNVPLAVVGLKCNGESIGEKMKKFSKFDTANRYTVKASFSSTWPERKKDRRLEAPHMHRPEVGTGERRRVSRGGLLCPELSWSDRYLNNATNSLETFKDNTGVVQKDVAQACCIEKTKVDERSPRISGFEPLSPQGSKLKEVFELDSLEIPLSLDDESKEFVELESLELQLSLTGDEPKEELELKPPRVQVSQSYEVKFLPLKPYSVPLSLGCKAEDREAKPQPMRFPVDDDVQSFASEMSPKDQMMHVEDLKEPSGAKSSGCETHRISVRKRNRGSEMQNECPFYEVFGDYRNIVVEFQTSQLSDEESSMGEDERILSTKHVAGENVYSLDGFTVGSKCVVWSSLNKTWSECQILEITEDGTRVLNLLNGIEDFVSPENVWNGIPKSDTNPCDVVFQTSEENASSNPLEDTTAEASGLPLVLPERSSANDSALSMKAEMGPSNSDNTPEFVRSSLQELNQEGSGEL